MPISYEVVWEQVKNSMPAGVTAEKVINDLPSMPASTVKYALSILKKSKNIYSRPMKKRAGVFKPTLIYFTDKDAYEKIKYVPSSISKKSRQPAIGLSTPVDTTKFFDIDQLTPAEARELHHRLSTRLANRK